MRRRDREVTGDAAAAILSRCETMTLAMTDGKTPYAVTVNFGVIHKGEQLELCFHTAPQGRKIDILAKNATVAFTMTASYQTVQAPLPCQWTANYESISGMAEASLVKEEEKEAYFDAIMRQAGCKGKLNYAIEALARTVIVKLAVTEISAKANKQ